MSYAVVLMTITPEVALAEPVASTIDGQPDRSQVVRDTSTGECAPWPVYERARMPVGTRVPGPAIISEDETSTLVNPGWWAFVNGLGYIEITQEGS